MKGTFSAEYIARRVPCIVSRAFCAASSALCIASFASRFTLRAARTVSPASRRLHPDAPSNPTETDSMPLPASADAERRGAWRKLARNRNVIFTCSTIAK